MLWWSVIGGQTKKARIGWAPAKCADVIMQPLFSLVEVGVEGVHFFTAQDHTRIIGVGVCADGSSVPLYSQLTVVGCVVDCCGGLKSCDGCSVVKARCVFLFSESI